MNETPATALQGLEGLKADSVRVEADLRAELSASRAEVASLRESEREFRSYVEQSPIGVFICDEKAQYRQVNPAASQITGYTKEELLGFSIADLLPSAPEQLPTDLFLELKATGRITAEYPFRHKDGHDGICFMEAIRLSPTRFMGMVIDVSARKRTEEELRLLNKKLADEIEVRTAEREKANTALATKEEEIRSVVDHMADCVITISETGTIHSVNPAVGKTFGFTEEELLGGNVSLLVPDPDPEAGDGYIERFFRTNQTAFIGTGREVEGVHKNGERIQLDLTLSKYSLQGRRIYTCILRDIRERMRIMQDLDQARLDAEQANRAKSAFLAAMSHEIRTPMNGVIGMADVLQQTSLKDFQVEIVETIRESANSLLGIIEDILDFSKIEAGKLELENRPMSVAAIVEQVCDLLDNLAIGKGVELTLFTDPAVPELVQGDGLRLRQVLINLASNGIKFSSGNHRTGRVSVRTRLLEQGPEGVEVEFQVTDNGIGMDEATQEGLFTSFGQADRSTTRRFGGTGLGLVISRHLVELKGGEISLQSIQGHGSTFTVRLPFQLAPAKPDLAPASDVEGLCCLVVGGHDSMADDLGAYLCHGGATVERVPSLAAAGQGASWRPAGPWIWVIDAGDDALSMDELQAAAQGWPRQEVRFVIIGRGDGRKPGAVAPGFVQVDRQVLNRRNFFKAVAIIAGRAQPDLELPGQITSAPFSPPTREEARQQGRLILVAEDNETNQKVILLQLGLLGLAADFARDGREALDAWRRGNYGLLLTDLHMPHMDGYELSGAIRVEEAGSRRIPIVALSANALLGEAERCREAGMDDYLSKPAPLNKLKALLGKWLPKAEAGKLDLKAEAGKLDLKAGPEPAAPIAVDVRVLEALVGDDQFVIQDLLRGFRGTATVIVAELQEACDQEDTRRALAAAHKLKSAARAVGALELGELCAHMEQAGKEGLAQRQTQLMPGLKLAFTAVERCLDTLLQ